MSMSERDASTYELEVEVLVVGAGACGCTAALAARGEGAQVMVLERDAAPSGNTALSGGQIPAGGSRLQKLAGINDAAQILEEDLRSKAKGLSNREVVKRVASASGSTIDWLVEAHGVPLSCISNFIYPGHTVPHMHASPSRFGAEILASLLKAVHAEGIDLVTSARVVDLYRDRSDRISGVRVQRSDGVFEDLGCQALILACNGYGGNPDMVKKYIPEMAAAHYHGHSSNEGDAIRWGEALGASLADMGSFQGHGAVCTPHNIHLGWPVITEGGIQVNRSGLRFSNENEGYSEQALHVIRQRDHVAWTVWDQRCEDIAAQMHSHQAAMEAGAIRQYESLVGLSSFIGCEAATFQETFEWVELMCRGEVECPWGRSFESHRPLAPPYYVAKVQGALFHTQGGLEVDQYARVLRSDGSPFDNLFAGGGAARGFSGPSDWGYLSGSGLLSATVLGRFAGVSAAKLVVANRTSSL